MADEFSLSDVMAMTPVQQTAPAAEFSLADVSGMAPQAAPPAGPKGRGRFGFQVGMTPQETDAFGAGVDRVARSVLDVPAQGLAAVGDALGATGSALPTAERTTAQNDAARQAYQQQYGSTVPNAIRGVGLGIRDVAEGVAGPLYNGAAAPLAAMGVPINSLAQNLTAVGLPEPQTRGEKLTSAIIQPVAGTLTGQGIGRAMMGAASPVVQGVGQALAAQPGTQAAAAAVGGGVGEATGSPTAGLVAGLATPLAGAAIGRVVSPNVLGNIDPVRAAVLAAAEQEGVPLTLAQQTGGRVARNFESTLANLPGSSGVQAQANEAQQRAFNAAVLRRSGADAEAATPDVLNAARADIGQQFQALSARNNLTPDQQFATEIQDIATRINRYVPESQRGPLTARLEDVVAGFQNGPMPGPAYQQMQSDLGKAMRSTSDGYDRMHMGEIRDALRNAMDRSISPEDSAAWQQARERYAALMQTAKAVDRPTEGTSLGNISPAALAQATRNQQSKSFAFGRGNMDDLARLGQVALKQTSPDSWTAQRTLMTNLLTGGVPAAGMMMASGQNPLYTAAAAAAGLAGPRLAAGLYHSNAMNRYLTNNVAAGLTPQPNALLGASIAAEEQAGRLRDR